jgi:hypothetical protein
MDTLVTALGPAFAAGFALQQLLEILDPLIEKIARDWKKMLLALVSFAFGLILAFGAGIRVLVHLGYSGGDLWDAIITALIVSAGTEGINSIMKYLGYAKENKKEEAGARAAEMTAVTKKKK